jgi:hypothetical protein
VIRDRIRQVDVATLHAHPVHLILQEPQEAAEHVTRFLTAHPLG